MTEVREIFSSALRPEIIGAPGDARPVRFNSSNAMADRIAEAQTLIGFAIIGLAIISFIPESKKR